MVAALHQVEVPVLHGRCDELAVRTLDAVPAARDDVYGAFYPGEVLGPDIGLGEHHSHPRVVLVPHPLDNHPQSAQRGRVGVGAADEEAGRDLGMLDGEQQSDDAPVAVSADHRILDLQLPDEVVQVVGHVNIVVLPVERRRALPVAAGIHQIHDEGLLQIIDGAVEDRVVLAVAVEHDQCGGLLALAPDLVVQRDAVGGDPHADGMMRDAIKTFLGMTNKC